MIQKVTLKIASILGLSEEKVLSLYNLLDDELAEKIKRNKEEADRLRSLVAYSIASLSINKPLPIHFKKKENGKPYVEGALPFSISHSGTYVVYAESDKEVGVDVQRIDNADALNIASRFFHKDEVKALEKEEDPKGLFYELWSKKESKAKLSGVGLKGEILKKSILNDELTKLVPFNEDYVLAVSGVAPLEIKLVEISIEELLKKALNN